MEEKYSNNIESLQNMIIKMKLNLLFGYTTEEVTLKEFNKYRDLLSERTSRYNKIQKTFLNIVNDSANKSIIEDKENQLLILIDSLKQMNKEYLLKIDVLLLEEKNKYIDEGASGRLAGAGLKAGFNSKYFNSSLTYSFATNRSQLITSDAKENKMIYFEISTGCC